jgi:hypothetical protein
MEGWKRLKLSSGVEVEYGPFPANMYWDIQARALEDHPDPEPPKKVVETFDGTEEVDDLQNPEYVAALNVARLARFNLLGEAALEFCVEVLDWERWEPKVKRLAEKYVKEKPPEDPVERKVWFLAKFAIRTPGDWNLIRKVQSFSQIEDEEVRQRAEFFRGDVAGPEGAGADAPGAAPEQRVAVQG